MAPMDGYTDNAFRQNLIRYSKPDTMFTEFTSVEGICSGAIKPLEAFKYSPSEHPIVAQLFGTNPECFYKATIIALGLGFDGIDINMGCPAHVITSKGAGADLIRNPELSSRLAAAVKNAITDWKNGLSLNDLEIPGTTRQFIQQQNPGSETKPIKNPGFSIKTRIGYNKNEVNTWINHVAKMQPDTIILHGRTFAQMYAGSADWDAIGRAAGIAHDNNILLAGNGDIKTIEEGIGKCSTYNLDGFMIGRAALGNPFVFNKDSRSQSLKNILNSAISHVQIFAELQNQPFIKIRKHLVMYCKKFPGASDTRKQLMETENAKDVIKILMDLVREVDKMSTCK